MSSFWAGFGEGFQRSYEAGLERSAQERRDKLRMQFDDYRSRRDEENKRKQQDGEDWKKAEGIVAERGLPSEIAADVYRWIKEGRDISDIDDRLNNGVFTKKGAETSVEQPQTATPVTSGQGAGSAQPTIEPAAPVTMADAPVTPVETAPVQPATGDYSGTPSLAPPEAPPQAPTGGLASPAPDQTRMQSASPAEQPVDRPGSSGSSVDQIMKSTPPAPQEPSVGGLATPTVPEAVPAPSSTPIQSAPTAAPVRDQLQTPSVNPVAAQADNIPMPSASPQATPVAGSQSPIQSEMQSAGMTPPPRPQAPVQPPMRQPVASAPAPLPAERKGPLGNLLSTMSGKFGPDRSLGAALGRPQAEIDAVGTYVDTRPRTSGYQYTATPADPYLQKDGVPNSLDEATAAQHKAESLGDYKAAYYYSSLVKKYEDQERAKSASRARENGFGTSPYVEGVVINPETNEIVSGIELDKYTGEPLRPMDVPEGFEYRQMTQRQYEGEEKVRKSIAPKLEKAQVRQNAYFDMLQTGKNMSEIANESGGIVLADRAVNIASWLSDAANDVSVGYTILSNAMNEDGTGNAGYMLNERDLGFLKADVAQKALAYEQSLLGGLDRAKALNDLFQAQRAFFSYQIGMAMGQDGRSLAEAERLLFSNIAASGNKQATFDSNLANVLNNVETSVDNELYSAVEGDSEYKFFYNQNKFKPRIPHDKTSKMIEEQPRFDTKSGPQNTSTRDFYKKVKNTPVVPLGLTQRNVGAEQEKKGKGPLKNYPKEIAPASLERLKADPSMWEDFEEFYGPGSSKPFVPKARESDLNKLRKAPTDKNKAAFDKAYKWKGAADYYLGNKGK